MKNLYEMGIFRLDRCANLEDLDNLGAALRSRVRIQFGRKQQRKATITSPRIRTMRVLMSAFNADGMEEWAEHLHGCRTIPKISLRSGQNNAARVS